MLGIVVSREDPASVTIGQQLRDVEEWAVSEDDSRADADGGGTVYRTDSACLREFDDLHLHLERPADAFEDPDLVVFASKHAGETGRLLTAHHTGNFGPADHGGRANELPRACPSAHARVLEALAAHAPPDYEVGMECTHHGPSTVGAPSMFVEVGSSEAQWEDPDAARAVARAILELRDVTPDRESSAAGDDADASHWPGPTGDDGAAERGAPLGDAHRRHLVGFGGGHYAPRFERVVRETDWAFGHVAADWGIEALDDLESSESRAVIEAAFEQSRAAYALVDGDRSAVETAVADLGYRPVSETWVRETDGVDLGLVSDVEAALSGIDDGLRFGDPAEAVDADSDWSVTALPAELLAEANNIDHGRTRQVFATHCIAFETTDGGTRPLPSVALPVDTEPATLVEVLATILEDRYRSVEIRQDAVVARVEEFDPERARTLGVPEGPAFGRLAEGEPVEVDGETIPPDVVRTERERRFPLE